MILRVIFVLFTWLHHLGLAQVLTVFTPCHDPTKSFQPVTITAQHQLVSTCSPSTACIKGRCSKEYSFRTFAWVSTVIPCAWDGTALSSCTVTNTEQAVTVSRTSVLSTVTSRSSNVPNPIVENKSTLFPTEKVFESKWQWWTTPYDRLGPLAIPGYNGSGLHGTTCVDTKTGSFQQSLNLTTCERHDLDSSPICARRSETWTAPASPKPEGSHALLSIQQQQSHKVPTKRPRSNIG